MYNIRIKKGKIKYFEVKTDGKQKYYVKVFEKTGRKIGG